MQMTPQNFFSLFLPETNFLPRKIISPLGSGVAPG